MPLDLGQAQDPTRVTSTSTGLAQLRKCPSLSWSDLTQYLKHTCLCWFEFPTSEGLRLAIPSLDLELSWMTSGLMSWRDKHILMDLRKDLFFLYQNFLWNSLSLVVVLNDFSLDVLPCSTWRLGPALKDFIGLRPDLTLALLNPEHFDTWNRLVFTDLTHALMDLAQTKFERLLLKLVKAWLGVESPEHWPPRALFDWYRVWYWCPTCSQFKKEFRLD